MIIVGQTTSGVAGPLNGSLSSTAEELVATFLLSVSGGVAPYSYAWNFGDGGTSTQQNPQHTYATAGTYTATVTVSDAEGRTLVLSDVVAVPVVAPLSASLVTSKDEGEVTFTLTVSGGVAPYAYAWNFDDGGTSTQQSPVHTYILSGVYNATVTITDAQGGSVSLIETISVSAIPPLGGTIDSNVAGDNAAFAINVYGGVQPYTYAWDFGDGGTSTVQNPMHTYTATGSYNASVVITDDRGETLTLADNVSVVVIPPLVASFTSSIVDKTVDFALTVSGGTSPYTYSWNFGDGSTSNTKNPQHTYPGNGSYTVSVSVIDSQGRNVIPSEQIAINVVSPLTGSLSSFVTDATAAFDLSISGGVAPYSYAWDFGDGNSDTVQDPSHVYAATGNYSASVVVTDSQGNSITLSEAISITVIPPLAASVSTVINGGTVDFTSTPSGGVAPYTFAWDFGDGAVSIDQNPSHTYAVSGTYTVLVSVGDDEGTIVDVYETVSVIIVPPLAGSISSSISGATASLSLSVSGGVVPYSYAWDFGDGNTSTIEDPSHTYAASGTYTASVVVTDDQGNTITLSEALSVVVIPPLTASVSKVITGGTVDFTLTPSGGVPPYTFAWDFGDGAVSIDQNPSHTYAASGTYTVLISIGDDEGTIIDITETVSVNVVSPLSGSLSSVVADATADFDLSVSGGVAPYSYAWDLGDGNASTVEDPSHTYAASGTYTASVTVTDDQSDTLILTETVSVTVVPPLSGSISANSQFSPTIEFNLTVSGGVAPYSYAWDFGDGNTSTTKNPSNNYAASGTYTATVTITDDQGDTLILNETVSVTVVPPLSGSISTASPFYPTYEFSLDVSGGTPPYTYAWDFDDGNTSTVEDPTHTYTAGGLYTASVVVNDSGGDSIFLSKELSVIIEVLNASLTKNVSGNTADFSLNVDGGFPPYTYAWDFGDGNSDTVEDPSHTYAATGSYTASVVVTDTQGGSITLSENVQIADPLAGVIELTVSGNTADLNLTVIDGVAPYTYSWDFGDGNTDTVEDPSHAYATGGTYTAIVVVVDSQGNSLTLTKVVTIAAPVASLSYDSSTAMFTDPEGVDFPDYTWAGLEFVGGRIDTSSWAVVACTDWADLQTKAAGHDDASPTVYTLAPGTYPATGSVVFDRKSNWKIASATPGSFVYIQHNGSGAGDGAILVDGSDDYSQTILSTSEVRDRTTRTLNFPSSLNTGVYYPGRLVQLICFEQPSSVEGYYRLGGQSTPDTEKWAYDILRIESVSGTQVTFNRPIGISHRGEALEIRMRALNASQDWGIEDLYMWFDNNPGGSDLISVKKSGYGYIKNCTLEFAGRHPVGTYETAHIEIDSDCYFNDAWNKGGGGTGYGGTNNGHHILWKADMANLRHSPNAQDWSSWIVFTDLTNENADMQMHTKFTSGILFDKITQLQGADQEDYTFRGAGIENVNGSHQPSADFNTLFLVDASQDPGKTGGGMGLLGLMWHFRCAYSRFTLTVKNWDGNYKRINQMVSIHDHMEDVRIHKSVFENIQDDGGWAIMFSPGFVPYDQASGGDWGYTDRNTHKFFSADTSDPDFNNATLLNQGLLNTSDVKMTDVKFVGFQSGRQEVGPGSLDSASTVSYHATGTTHPISCWTTSLFEAQVNYRRNNPSLWP